MWRCRAAQRLLILVAAIFTIATQAANSCFQNDPPYKVVRGTPFVLTWKIDIPGSDFDISLATTDHTSLGYISSTWSLSSYIAPTMFLFLLRTHLLIHQTGNVTASSLVWTPPLNISSGPFTLALFLLDRQSICFSPNFTISGSENVQYAAPSASLVTTVVTNNMVPATVTATVGSWTPNVAALATTAATSTKAATATAVTMVPSDDAPNSNSKMFWKIGLAIGMGVLVVLVIVLGVFLWKAKQKKQSEELAQEHGDDVKLKFENTSNRSSAHSPLTELQVLPQRSELPVTEQIQLDSCAKPEGWRPDAQYMELNGQERYEVDGMGIIAELPGDEPVRFPEKK